MKYYFIAAFIAILGCLASAGIFLLKDKRSDPSSQSNDAEHKNRMVWALTWRIVLSVALFISIWVFYALGWIQPTGIPLNAIQ
jgi:Protein of unknown function (DUF2909)